MSPQEKGEEEEEEESCSQDVWGSQHKISGLGLGRGSKTGGRSVKVEEVTPRCPKNLRRRVPKIL